jgi:phage terminase Nu1 subunit (DNA packaging protein)
MTGDSITTATEEPKGTDPQVAGEARMADVIELEGRRYATQPGLARLLGVTTRTLSRWDERRMGPPKIKIGRRVLYDLAKLHDWLGSHEREPVAPRTRGLRV